MFQYLYSSSFIFVTNLCLSESAKILAIAPVMSKSHHIIQQTMLQELAFKGHEIVSISYFKSNNNLTNYQEILINTDNDLSYIDSMNIADATILNTFWNLITYIQRREANICSDLLRKRYIQKLFNPPNSHKFDLLIAEFYQTKCFSLLAHKLNIPLIAINAYMSIGIDNFLGNPYNPAYQPYVVGGHTTKMNFFQRLTNTIYYTNAYWYHYIIHDRKLKQLSKEDLNIDLPSDDILNKKIALAFYNSHHSYISRSLSPKIQNIAGIHIREPKSLPKDILEFIESSKHGVIFFSFGSLIKASSIPPKKLENILKVFSTIPQKVLWRVNELNVSVPSKVKTGKWFPQRDILEHENVIAFISHCGMLSTFEAIHTATPVLGIPFVLDQPQNTNLLVEKEVAVRLDFENIDEVSLLNSIREITNNEKYKKNMLELSKIFKDRPISPLDNAVYWIEYVIKHKGADHLHLPSADMPLYQYLLIDVIFFVVILIVIIFYFGKNIIRVILSLMRNKGKDKIH